MPRPLDADAAYRRGGDLDRVRCVAGPPPTMPAITADAPALAQGLDQGHGHSIFRWVAPVDAEARRFYQDKAVQKVSARKAHESPPRVATSTDDLSSTSATGGLMA